MIILSINDLINIIIISILGTLLIYHFIIFFGRKGKNEIYNIYFCFFSLFICFYIIIASDLSRFIFKSKKVELFIVPILMISSICFGMYFSIKIFEIFLEIPIKKRKIFLPTYLLLLISIILTTINFIMDYNKYLKYIFPYVLLSSISGAIYYFCIFIVWIIKYKLYLKKPVKVVVIGFIIFGLDLILGRLIPFVKKEVNFHGAYIGTGITTFVFAYALACKFNQEHKDLIHLKNNLEQKVIERTKQLEETNKQKTIAFTNISHEIKTPLTIISNYIEKHIKNHGTTEEIKIARDNLNKLKRDIIDVLDFEKLDIGMAFYDHSQIIDVSKIVKMNILMFNELANRKNINIKYNIRDNIYTKIDINAMDRIISNLIDNAIKYTNSNGEINIILKADKKDIEIITQDTGIGISKEEQENIFKPYYQVSHKKSNIQGIGMGLNITKKIIDEAGGKIEVESKLNEGTKFTIKLKKHILTDKDIVQERIEYSTPVSNITDIKFKEEKYTESKNNIFIVEDNLEMLSYLQENLIDNFNIFYARDGKKALEKLTSIPKPDIIISDIMMDIMDGYEFYDNIKKSESFCDIPVLFLTAKSGINEKIKALSKGAIDFITKPFDINELLFKLNSILEVNIKHEKKFIESIYKSSKKQLKDVDEKIEAIDYDKFKEKFNLSNKEIEICKLIRERLTNKEIGQRLNKAESTIKNYINIIFEKLFVNKREKAIELMDEFKKRKF